MSIHIAVEDENIEAVKLLSSNQNVDINSIGVYL